MTTDTVPKAASRRVDVDGVPVTVTGIAKGAGMIHPNMATMLRSSPPTRRSRAAVLARWCARSPTLVQLHHGGRRHVDQRFLRADRHRPGGAAPIRAPATRALRRPRAPSTAVAVELAQAIVRDGEGATKFIAIRVEGGRDGRRVPQGRARHRALAAGEDRLLRLRPQPRAHPLRDRQRGIADLDTAPSRSGSTTSSSSIGAGARPPTARRTASA